MLKAAWTLGLTWLILAGYVTAEARDELPAAVGKVRLNLQITGLGPEGALVEIKPAHKACEFKPISRRLTAADRGRLELEPFDVKTTSADRDCTFSITVTEPKQASRTFRRGLRVSNPPADGIVAIQSLPCFLSYQTPPAQVAEGDKTTNPKK